MGIPWAARREVSFNDSKGHRLVLLQDFDKRYFIRVLDLCGPSRGVKELVTRPLWVSRSDLEYLADGELPTLQAGPLTIETTKYGTVYARLKGVYEPHEFFGDVESLGWVYRFRLTEHVRKILSGIGEPPDPARQKMDAIWAEGARRYRWEKLGWVPKCGRPQEADSTSEVGSEERDPSGDQAAWTNNEHGGFRDEE